MVLTDEPVMPRHRRAVERRDTKTKGALLAVPARVRGGKGSGDSVTVEFMFDPEEDD